MDTPKILQPWLWVPVLVTLSCNLWIAQIEVRLPFLILPIAFYLGRHFRRSGLMAVAVGASLLCINISWGKSITRALPDLYVLALLVCHLAGSGRSWREWVPARWSWQVVLAICLLLPLSAEGFRYYFGTKDHYFSLSTHFSLLFFAFALAAGIIRMRLLGALAVFGSFLLLMFVLARIALSKVSLEQLLEVSRAHLPFLGLVSLKNFSLGYVACLRSILLTGLAYFILGRWLGCMHDTGNAQPVPRWIAVMAVLVFVMMGAAGQMQRIIFAIWPQQAAIGLPGMTPSPVLVAMIGVAAGLAVLRRPFAIPLLILGAVTGLLWFMAESSSQEFVENLSDFIVYFARQNIADNPAATCAAGLAGGLLLRWPGVLLVLVVQVALAVTHRNSENDLNDCYKVLCNTIPYICAFGWAGCGWRKAIIAREAPVPLWRTLRWIIPPVALILALVPGEDDDEAYHVWRHVLVAGVIVVFFAIRAWYFRKRKQPGIFSHAGWAALLQFAVTLNLAVALLAGIGILAGESLMLVLSGGLFAQGVAYALEGENLLPLVSFLGLTWVASLAFRAAWRKLRVRYGEMVRTVRGPLSLLGLRRLAARFPAGDSEVSVQPGLSLESKNPGWLLRLLSGLRQGVAVLAILLLAIFGLHESYVAIAETKSDSSSSDPLSLHLWRAAHEELGLPFTSPPAQEVTLGVVRTPWQVIPGSPVRRTAREVRLESEGMQVIVYREWRRFGLWVEDDREIDHGPQDAGIVPRSAGWMESRLVSKDEVELQDRIMARAGELLAASSGPGLRQ